MWISRNGACPLVLALMALSLCTVNPGHAQENGDDVVIGKYHVVRSRILGEERKILVHVPRGYEDTTLEYPVVYHLYGDYELTYFADAVSILHRLHEAGKIPQVILVGVDNTDRYRDLRPVRRDGAPGGSPDFAKYLEKELMPFVDDRYRTADYRILVGPQAGSTFGMYVLMEREGLFDAVIIETSFLSPAPVREYLVDQASSFFRKDRSLKSFLFMKCRNDEQQPFLDPTKQLANIIESNKPQCGPHGILTRLCFRIGRVIRLLRIMRNPSLTSVLVSAARSIDARCACCHCTVESSSRALHSFVK